MIRKQTVYQIGFGGNIILGEAEEVENLLFEENENRWVDRALRGFYWMPPVSFGGLLPIESVWSRVEVRFDIQLEGKSLFTAGRYDFSEDILLRTFQWPLVAL
jgi:hypothetical protein